MSDIERISDVSPFDAIRQVDADGEHWTARDLQKLMEYARYENFAEVIDKAKASLALVEGRESAEHHFAIRSSDGGRWGNSKIEDFRLTRFGAYLTAMAGDDTKKSVAAARIYFAVKTRQAEVAPPAVTPPALPSRRELALMVVEAEDRAEAAELVAAQSRAELAVVAPKAEAWDVLASADGDFAVSDAAKVLSRDPNIKLGRGRLFSYLDEIGWVHRQRGDQRWRAYQAQIDLGRLSELPSSHYHPRTGALVLDPPQVRVTTKGLHELRRRLTAAPKAISST